jgi:hypothetical protein
MRDLFIVAKGLLTSKDFGSEISSSIRRQSVAATGTKCIGPRSRIARQNLSKLEQGKFNALCEEILVRELFASIREISG